MLKQETLGQALFFQRNKIVKNRKEEKKWKTNADEENVGTESAIAIVAAEERLIFAV